MRSLFITLCYASFFIVGAVAPFVFTLGYLWVDSFLPQAIAFSLINDLPVSMIAAIAAFGGYALLDRRDVVSRLGDGHHHGRGICLFLGHRTSPQMAFSNGNLVYYSH